MGQTFKTVDVLRLEVEDDPDGLVNLVQNPSGELGGWGWVTPTVNTLMSGGNDLAYRHPPNVASYFTTEFMALAAGQYVAGRLEVNGPVQRAITLRFDYYDSSRAFLSSSSTVVITAGTLAGVGVNIGAFLAPASTAFVVLRGDVTPGATGTLINFRFKNVTVAKAATSAELETVRTNLVPNPSFESNTSDWTAGTATTIARSTAQAAVGSASLAVTRTGSTGIARASQGVGSEIAVTPLIDYAVQARFRSASTGRSVSLSIEWLNAALSTISYTGAAGIDSAAGWLTLGATGAAPPTAVYARVFVSWTGVPVGEHHYLDAVQLERASTVGTYFDGATTPAGTLSYAWTGTANASASTETNSLLSYIDPVPYLNVLGPTHDIKITRDELDVGLLVATILDVNLDPAKAPLLRPGRRVRAMALDPATDSWEPLFFGKAQNAKVTYDLKTKVPDQKRARISLTAVDNISAVASVPRAEGVATIAELPFLLEGAGVPWNVNGSGNQVPSATVVANNTNASLLDQIAVTRDSVLGYAWVDRRGVVQVWDAAEISTSIAATFDEDDYTDLGIDYDTERCINTVNIKYLRINLATGETVEVPYGPYVDQDSVDQWGPRAADFTVQGIAEDSGVLQAYAEAIFAANATPTVRVNTVTLALREAADVTYALRDLYDLVTVSNDEAGLEQDLRIVSIEHTISPEKWLTAYSFGADGGVAPPQSTPSPAAAGTVLPGEWMSYNPVTSGSTMGDSTLTGKYTVIGKTVHAYIGLVVGAGFSGAAYFAASLPVPGVAGNPASVKVDLLDADSNWFNGYGNADTAWAYGYAQGADGAAVAPFSLWTWVPGDQLRMWVTYESV